MEEEIIPSKSLRKLNSLFLHNKELLKNKKLQQEIIAWAKEMQAESREEWCAMRATSIDAVIKTDRKQQVINRGKQRNKRYTSPLGYVSNGNQIDSYGVNHSGFTTRDELAYQTARVNRENDLMTKMNNQGITSYPQYTTNFWGTNADNNYGFGSSNTGSNIENMQTMTPVPQQLQPTQPQVSQQPESGALDTIKQWRNTAVNGIISVPEQIWKAGENLGELAADTKIAYDYWQKMNQTGNQLVKTFGSGQGADIDNYYHPLLQCELAKISPESRRNGIALGYAKEYLMDYPKKRFWQGKSNDEIMEDSQKDLQNNLYGNNLGYYNPNTSCEDLLDDRRTLNMRKLNIR